MEWCPVCQANMNVVSMQLGPLAVLHTCEKCRTTLRMDDVGTGKKLGRTLVEELEDTRKPKTRGRS